MKKLVSSKFPFAALAAALLISLSSIVFGESDDVPEQDSSNADECKMKAYTNPETMAAAMADPVKFMEFVALMNNPQTAQNLMECGMDSNQWNAIMADMSNPTKVMNAMGQFMNPQMYMAWMTAGMNPAFYQSQMNTYMNPALYMQWMTAGMNPAFYQAPMTKMANPKWQQETTAWMMNPANFQKMFEGMYNIAPVVADAIPAK